MYKIIRWGVIGCGNIAHTFCKALLSLPHARLVAVAATSENRAKQFAKEYLVEDYYDNYPDLVANPTVDAVYIANSHPFHYQSLLLCLQNGKAVLCEKPLTINAQQAKAAMDLAREKQVFLMEAMWMRFLPAIVHLKKIIEAGIIGDVRLLKADFGFATHLGVEGRHLNRQLGGGALLDVGIYPISLAYYLLGSRPATTEAYAYMGATGVDEFSTYMLQYDNGAVAQLSSAININTPKNALIIGTKGQITVPFFWRAESLLVEVAGQAAQTFDFPFACNGFEYEIEAATNWITAGKTDNLIMPLEETLAIMQLMDGFRKRWGLVYDGE